MKFSENHKIPYQLWLGTTLMITISKPEHIEIVLKDQNALDKHMMYDFMKPILYDGLITSKGKTTRNVAPTNFHLFRRKMEATSQGHIANVQSKNPQHVCAHFRSDCNGTD